MSYPLRPSRLRSTARLSNALGLHTRPPVADPHGDFASNPPRESAKNCLWPGPPHKGSGRPETVPPSTPGPALPEAPDGILGCEAAQLPASVFLRLRGRIAERRGWLWLSGTFEGSRGWYADKFRAWQLVERADARAFSIPSWENRAIYPGGREDPEIADLEAMFPPDLFMERFGGVPCPPSTLVFREFNPRVHMSNNARASGLPVELAIDPGYAGAYAVLAIEQRGPEVAVIDEVYLRRRVAGDVIAACRERPWWPQVRGSVIDIAGPAAPCGAQPDRSLGLAGGGAAALAHRSTTERHRPSTHIPARSGQRCGAPDCSSRMPKSD